MTSNDTQRVVVLGMDACDVDLIQRWAGEGRMPFLASMMKAWPTTRIHSTYDMFADSPWPSFNAGVSPAKHAFFNHLQLDRGTLNVVRVDATDCRSLPFWSHLKGSGKRVVAFDVPKTFPIEGLDGVQISAWGEHYPLLKEPTSIPPDAIERIQRRFGDWPHPPEVAKPWSRWQERRLLRTLQDNIEKKTQVVEHLLENEAWDLFITVFSACHYGGHQFYHLYDPSHWAYDAGAPRELREALPDLYTQFDAALARVFEKVPDDVTFFIVSVHGLVANYSANQLMPEALMRLGFSARPPVAGPPTNTIGRLVQLATPIRRAIPMFVRRFINAHLLPESVHDSAASSRFANAFDWSRTQAFMLECDHFQSFLSLNLKGREPYGVVEPGEEAERVLEHLMTELYRLVNPATGEPAVGNVTRVADVYQGPNLSELPELVVQWSSDAPIDGLAHPDFETIEPVDWRLRKTAHAAEGLLIAGGPSIRADAEWSEMPASIDVAPTVLEMLGVAVPDEMEGRVLAGILNGARWSAGFADAAEPTSR